jgi:enoyl-CoA hydratase/carnithine racemase
VLLVASTLSLCRIPGGDQAIDTATTGSENDGHEATRLCLADQAVSAVPYPVDQGGAKDDLLDLCHRNAMPGDVFLAPWYNNKLINSHEALCTFSMRL